MKICGIVTEYNPFHKGHLYQIEKTRELLGEDTAVVCCMSGDFVQRGEAALLNKNLRAKMAVRGGADLVLSLPLRWSLSSAQGFADGAIHILNMAGVDHISFGAEDADIGQLTELAELIAEKSVIDGTIQNMEEGLPFALARERELYKRIKERSALISKPNNILAIEYIRALKEQGSKAVPVAVGRLGADHDGEEASEGVASASHIRELIRSGSFDEVEGFMPASSFEMICRAEEQGVLMDDLYRLDCAMTAVLSRMTAEDMAKLPDAAEGLENRLAEAVKKGRTFGEICDIAKTKRYAHSRIRRMLYCAFLGIEKQEKGLPGFSRVLAFNDRGRAVLSRLEQREDFTFITKPAAAKYLNDKDKAEFELEARAADIYDMALPAFTELKKGREWVQGAKYIR
ncbi:MAG: nucleotidyltransferase family protein [Clostridia bacterium]|nr:nucleotidyltransferase family protein [Clostridia bacterium]